MDESRNGRRGFSDALEEQDQRDYVSDTKLISGFTLPTQLAAS
jgi:hypothetical protein